MKYFYLRFPFSSFLTVAYGGTSTGTYALKRFILRPPSSYTHVRSTRTYGSVRSAAAVLSSLP